LRVELIDFILCPYCKGHLDLVQYESNKNEIIEGALVCSCGNRYPIIKGVPRILPDRFKNFILKTYYPNFSKKFKEFLKTEENCREETQIHELNKRTSKVFGYEWHEFPVTNFQETYHKDFISWMSHPFDEDFLKNKQILDVGCGGGNYSSIMGGYKAKVVGIDLSVAVDEAYKNTKDIKDVDIIQADILSLPLKEKFDMVFCVGVLHHLTDPKKGFHNLLKVLKKDGYMFLRVYSKEGNKITIYLVDKVMKKIIRKLPFKVVNGICWSMAHLLNLSLSLLYLPLNRNKFLRKIGKKLPYNNYFLYISNFDFRHKQNIFFDVLSAPVVHYYSKKDLEELFKGLKIISIKGDDILSWKVLAQKV